VQIETIFRIALLVVATLSVVAFLVGFALGQRQMRNGSRIVILTALALLVLIVGGTYPLAVQHGPGITFRAFWIAVALSAGLQGGFTVSRRLQKGSRAMAVLGLTATLIIVGVAMQQIHLANSVVTRTVKELGLDTTEKYEPEKNKDCPENLRSLYIAFSMYTQDWDALPPAANWLENEDLTSKVRQDEWLHCPAVSNRHDDKYGYAYNESVAGRALNHKPLKEMPDAGKTPLVYDSTKLNKNAHDAVTSLPKPGRHSGRNNILYCDGHVEAVAP
jgi:prepilin-type processing-associated H-X9-DG protein